MYSWFPESGSGLSAPLRKKWIASVGCDIFGGGISALGWKEGEMDLVWDRSVSKADGNQLTLDAPLTMALDNKWGTVKVLRYSWSGRIAEAGLENLTLALTMIRSILKMRIIAGRGYL